MEIFILGKIKILGVAEEFYSRPPRVFSQGISRSLANAVDCVHSFSVLVVLLGVYSHSIPEPMPLLHYYSGFRVYLDNLKASGILVGIVFDL